MTAIENQDLSPGEHLHYPGIGVGVVAGIQPIDIGEDTLQVLIFEAAQKDVTVQVPLNNIEGLGIRRVVSQKRLEGVLSTLTDPHPIAKKPPTWNRRFRKYTEKIQTGQPRAICEVLAELHQIRLKKRNKKSRLSFGERRMYDKAHSILAAEVGLVKDLDEEAAKALIDKLLHEGTDNLKPRKKK